MKSNLVRRALVAALVTIAVFTSIAASTAPIGQVAVELKGSVTRNGQALPLEQAGKVYPGEIINWNIAVANQGDTSTTPIRAVGKIPAGTLFIPGSPSGDSISAVKYSIDNGRSFSERPMIKVTGGDGVQRDQPAPVESYTDIQFTFGSLNARDVKNARYQTRVR